MALLPFSSERFRDSSDLILTSVQLVLIMLLIALGACKQSTKPEVIRIQSDSSLELSYAKGFTIEYYDSASIVSLLSLNDTLRYLLLPESTRALPDLIYDQIIQVPVDRMVIQSTTHLAFTKVLDSPEVVVGLDNAAYVYDSVFTNLVNKGSILEVSSGNTFNTERVLSLQPNLILVSHMPGNDLTAYQKFVDLGISVLPIAEWTESTPLGKAEWIKLFAALLGKQSLAKKEFERTSEAYNNLVQLTQSVSETPSTIVGLPFQGTWYVPGAVSYRNAFLQDAKAEWAFSRDSTAVSFPVSFEKMYDLGLQADIWLDPGQANSKEVLLGIDSRISDFKSYKTGRIYNSNRRMNPAGTGNDYYESGVVYPQRILADLIKILHPDLLPDHKLYYYQPLP